MMNPSILLDQLLLNSRGNTLFLFEEDICNPLLLEAICRGLQIRVYSAGGISPGNNSNYRFYDNIIIKSIGCGTSWVQAQTMEWESLTLILILFSSHEKPLSIVMGTPSQSYIYLEI